MCRPNQPWVSTALCGHTGSDSSSSCFFSVSLFQMFSLFFILLHCLLLFLSLQYEIQEGRYGGVQHIVSPLGGTQDIMGAFCF